MANVERRVSSPERVIRVSGYFFEAAVAWYRATGKRKVLDTALKAIDAIDAAYGPGKKTYIAGHEGLEIGLLAMYRQTGDQCGDEENTPHTMTPHGARNVRALPNDPITSAA